MKVVQTSHACHNAGKEFGFPLNSQPNLVVFEVANEDKLFEGMCAALEVLKQIHKERGEDVDSVPEFKKRKLQTNEK